MADKDGGLQLQERGPRASDSSTGREPGIKLPIDGIEFRKDTTGEPVRISINGHLLGIFSKSPTNNHYSSRRWILIEWDPRVELEEDSPSRTEQGVMRVDHPSSEHTNDTMVDDMIRRGIPCRYLDTGNKDHGEILARILFDDDNGGESSNGAPESIETVHCSPGQVVSLKSGVEYVIALGDADVARWNDEDENAPTLRGAASEEEGDN
ncbi:hypothetical protein BDV95DRAFT_607170 [Massariosphaeria phaeospora]|uniref:Uncharacterized protein n=1 Tax=Massariosphaeria phaeospora TaxID=100035 RepID=A0A7C8MF30_9PLEO|nr:hypothetical protein BDV95DRAFT_607170 [Massariosphaeria phaeospora]